MGVLTALMPSSCTFVCKPIWATSTMWLSVGLGVVLA